jgi:hypothetical protein
MVIITTIINVKISYQQKLGHKFLRMFEICYIAMIIPMVNDMSINNMTHSTIGNESILVNLMVNQAKID